MDELNIHKEEIELKIHEQKEASDLSNHWRSCCFDMDKRATIFSVHTL